MAHEGDGDRAQPCLLRVFWWMSDLWGKLPWEGPEGGLVGPEAEGG